MEERSGAQYNGDIRAMLLDVVWPEDGLPSLLDLGPSFDWTYNLPGVTRHVVIDPDEANIEQAKTELAKLDIQSQCFAMDPLEYIRGRAEGSVNAVMALNYITSINEQHRLFLIGQMERVAKNLAVVWRGSRYEIDAFGTGWTIIYFPDWFGEQLTGATLGYKIIEPLDRNVDPLAPTVDEVPWL